MEEAQRLSVVSPTPEPSPNANKYCPSPLPIVDSGASVLELLRSMSNQEEDEEDEERERQEELEEKEKEEKERKILLSMSDDGKKPRQSTGTASTLSPLSSSSLPWKQEKKASPFDMDAQELKLRCRPLKKAPSPPSNSSDQQTADVTVTVTKQSSVDLSRFII